LGVGGEKEDKGLNGIGTKKNAQAVNANCAVDKHDRSMSFKGRHSTAATVQFFNGYQSMVLAK